MALYKNSNATSGLEAVEFIPRPDANVAFFYTKNQTALETLKSELKDLGQELLTESMKDGKPVLITRGTKTQGEVICALAQRQEALELPPPKKEFHPWEWRGRFSDIGQTLNLASAKFSGKKLEGDKLAFAALNLTANWVNKKYGAQKAEDANQLGFLKSHINDIVSSSLQDGTSPPAIDDHRAQLRSEPPKPKSAGEKFNEFMKKNSVRLGEIGLRYIGSVALVLSYPQLKKMGSVQSVTEKEVMVNGEKKLIQSVTEKFSWHKALDAMKEEPLSNAKGLLNKNKTLLYTGAIYLAGKTLGLIFARTPDPYDPKPKTAFDSFREKYAFRVSTVIETAAASTLAIGSFRKKDYLGGVGGSIVGMGLVSRFYAPFGIKQVNQQELNAHIVDSVALVPQEKRAKVLARVSAFLKEHFKDAPETYGEVFTRLKDKLYHDRGIALYPEPVQQPAASSDVRQAPISESAAPGIEDGEGQNTFADERLKKSRPEMLLGSHVERASQPAQMQAGISV